MAENFPLRASKIVQELATKGGDIPEEYLYKDGYPNAIDAPDDLWRDDLLIDFSLLSSSSAPELEKLRSALSQWGCLQERFSPSSNVINHGIESSFLEDLIEVSKQFFALPLEEKFKCSAADEIFQGYGSDSLTFGTQTRNWNDRLLLFFYPKEIVRRQCWPQKPVKFSAMIEEYAKKIATVNTVIYNEVDGLQILKGDQWYKVSVVPGALLINLGELGEAMTNGVFKSVVHKVSTNSVKDRMSVAMFFSPDDEEIKPLSGLVSADQPQLYKNINMNEYMQKLNESFRLGSRAIDAFQV
uniref:Fe2OG dioxygenase domain-containing protein n=1 Tax=Chenopodium quinoa TaxID=63459 RepID=A0A803LH20_CHEQI